MLKHSFNRKSGYDEIHGKDDLANPMESMANMADIMLVLVLGILCAFVIHWHMDLSHKSGEVLMSTDYTPVEAENQQEIPEDALEKYGTVYTDAEGNLYIKADE